MVSSTHRVSVRRVMTHLPSTYIYFYEDERATRSDLAIYVGSVPVEHLASFPDRLRASLARIAEGRPGHGTHGDGDKPRREAA
jgi:hypothetical protein